MDALGMIVHRHSQLVAALGTPPLQDDLAIGRLHSGAETVYTQSTMNLWLISPLRHSTFLSKPEISIELTNNDYTATCPGGQTLPAKNAAALRAHRRV